MEKEEDFYFGKGGEEMTKYKKKKPEKEEITIKIDYEKFKKALEKFSQQLEEQLEKDKKRLASLVLDD